MGGRKSADNVIVGILHNAASDYKAFYPGNEIVEMLKGSG